MAEVETKEKWNNEQISYENNYRSPLSSNTVSTQHKHALIINQGDQVILRNVFLS